MNAEKGVAGVSWQNINHGSHVFEAGSAQNFHTGDWRSQRPVFVSENCRHCLLCTLVCPDSAIIVKEQDGDMKVQGYNYDFCKGCLVCKEACNFKAIEKEDE